MCLKIFVIFCSLISGYDFFSTSYDQSQTGDLNVQVDVKDVQIIALLKGGKEDYVDYDYAYDYSEMTIKPQNGTTSKPLNVASADSDLMDNTTVISASSEQTTEPVKNITLQNVTLEVTSMPAFNESTTTVKTAAQSVTTEILDVVSDKNTTLPPSANSTDCKKGFVLNHKGDCELKLQSTSNALLKLVKLSQKLKLRRENRRNNNNSN